jgi:hypothetical protein
MDEVDLGEELVEAGLTVVLGAAHDDGPQSEHDSAHGSEDGQLAGAREGTTQVVLLRCIAGAVEGILQGIQVKS